MDKRFLDTSTLTVLDATQLQQRLRHVGAPHCLEPAELADLGFDVVDLLPAPALGPNQTLGEPVLSQEDGRWRLSTPVIELPPEPIESIRARARLMVDAEAEAARLRWITPGSGQAMVYQQKAAEARDHMSGGAGPWPHLDAELGVTGTTLADVAARVLSQESVWRTASAEIEAIRLGAKRDIGQADTKDTVEAVVAAVAWPQPL